VLFSEEGFMRLKRVIGASVFAVLSLASACLGQEKEKAGKELSEFQITKIVREAAAVCRETPMPREGHGEEGDYLRVIEPLLAAGKKSLPALRKVAVADSLDRFEARVAQILVTRVENPRIFQAIRPYYTPKTQAKPRKEEGLIRSYGLMGPGPSLKPLTPELIDIADRTKWRQLVKISKDISEKYKGLIAKNPQDRRALLLSKTVEYTKAIAELKLSAFSGGSWKPLPDRAYLLAWEEAMIRPLRWRMRADIAEIVCRINNPASIPTLAQVLTDRFLNQDKTGLDRLTHGRVCNMLVSYPRNETLVSLASVLGTMKTDDQRRSLRALLGRAVRDKPRWRALLKTASGVAELRPHAEELQRAIDWSKVAVEHSRKQHEDKMRAMLEPHYRKELGFNKKEVARLDALFSQCLSSTKTEYVRARDRMLTSRNLIAYLYIKRIELEKSGATRGEEGVAKHISRLLKSEKPNERVHARILNGWLQHKELYVSLVSDLRSVEVTGTRDAQFLCHGFDGILKKYDSEKGRPLLYEQILKYPGEDITDKQIWEEWEKAPIRIGQVKLPKAPKRSHTALERTFIRLRFRSACIYRLARSELAGDADLAYILSQVAKRKKDAANIWAIQGLGQLGTANAKAVLAEIVSSKSIDKDGRQAAADALKKIKAKQEKKP
jgi:hypothetical protein